MIKLNKIILGAAAGALLGSTSCGMGDGKTMATETTPDKVELLDTDK